MNRKHLAAAAMTALVLAAAAPASAAQAMDKVGTVSISSAVAQAALASRPDSLASSFNSANKSISGHRNAATENRGAAASLAAQAFPPGDYKAVYTADPSPAMSAIQAVRSGLQNMNRISASIYIKAIQTGSTPSKAAQIARNARSADGGTT
ncbi:MAG TPA: hypothetical protein VIG76_04925 [Amnibacterium sp.]|jgi:hypothetical protein|uniref:hypothetical protein n=1 Tax=Amnibacterium sp. TaxID=1872496 RepID=UPI002F92050A